MGAIWVKTAEGWESSIPYGRASQGWAKSVKGYRKTAPTVWTDLYTTDFTPPGPPTITSVTIGVDLKVDQGRLNITVKAPSAADQQTVRVKVGKAVSVNNSTDANYVATVDASGKAWSEWTMPPNTSMTKTWPLAGGLTNNATYYVTAWAMDKTRNYSTPVNKSIKYVAPPVLAMPEHNVSIIPTDSMTIQKSNNAWLTGDKFVRTGGPYNYHGLWFYSTRMDVLKGAGGIESLTIEIQRYPGNLVGTTRFHLFSHKLASKPAGSIWSPSQIVYTDATWHSIERGQTLKLPIPPSWYGALLNGTINGFGIYTQTSANNDQYNNTMYGFGTYSGRLAGVYQK